MAYIKHVHHQCVQVVVAVHMKSSLSVQGTASEPLCHLGINLDTDVGSLSSF